MAWCRGFIVWLAACALAGCAAGELVNPSFPLSVEDARDAAREMTENPKPLTRPVVVLGGFVDPGIIAGHLASWIKKATGDSRIIAVSFALAGDFDACRGDLIREVEAAFPCDDPAWTTEVDVVAVSMGGLVARYATLPPGGRPDAKRLRIARLFTLSTPHRGARMATWPTLSRLQTEMRPDSAFMARMRVERQGARYTLYPYVRLGDTIVGEANSAPHGRVPWWLPNRTGEGAHLMAYGDPRLLAEIARRLRGEQPFTTEPPAPLPETDESSAM